MLQPKRLGMFASCLKLLAPVPTVSLVGISIQILDVVNFSIIPDVAETEIIFLLTSRVKSYAKVNRSWHKARYCFCLAASEYYYHSISSNFVCNLPLVIGTGRYCIPRWYYNRSSGKCKFFFYSGCNGNENNFQTYHLCQNLCEGTFTLITFPTNISHAWKCVFSNAITFFPDNTKFHWNCFFPKI